MWPKSENMMLIKLLITNSKLLLLKKTTYNFRNFEILKGFVIWESLLIQMGGIIL